MGTHLSKCFCNRIRQDGTILPSNSKIQIIFGASGRPWTPPETCPVPAGGLQRPQTPAGLANDLWSLHRPGQHFFHIHIGRVLWFLPSCDSRGLDFLVPKMILHRPCYTVNIAGPLMSSYDIVPTWIWIQVILDRSQKNYVIISLTWCSRSSLVLNLF